MFRKFIEGLVFGAGFGIAFMTIWYFSATVFLPRATASKFHDIEMHFARPDAPNRGTPEKPFDELGIDDQIKQASAIAIARYERAPDGEMKAIIHEFLKKNPGVELYYDVGDEYRTMSEYPREHTQIGDGVVIFFKGSPADMVLGMSYYGDRISGLGDLPLALLRDKCAKASPVSAPESEKKSPEPSKDAS